MSDIKGLREISNDPFGKLLTALSKKFSAFLAKDQAELVENPEDIYSDGQDVESALKYHNFAMPKKFDLQTGYYSVSEPDYDRVKIYFAVLPNLGTEIPDKSGFNNNATFNGEPILVDGVSFDYGLFDGANNVKSIAISFNRSTSTFATDERLRIDHNDNISVNTLTTGFSFFIRFRARSLADVGGISITLWEKIDDNTPNDAKMLQIKNDGRLACIIKKGGTTTAKQTATGTIVTDTVYDVFVTYAVSGNVIHVYVNNVDKTLTNNTDPVNWHADLTNHQLSIFNRGSASEGDVNGDLYFPLIYWDEKIVSATEVSHLYINKWTITDVPFGQVAITNYSATYNDSGLARVSKSQTLKWNVVAAAGAGGASFTTTSYTSTSYT